MQMEPFISSVPTAWYCKGDWVACVASVSVGFVRFLLFDRAGIGKPVNRLPSGV